MKMLINMLHNVSTILGRDTLYRPIIVTSLSLRELLLKYMFFLGIIADVVA